MLLIIALIALLVFIFFRNSGFATAEQQKSDYTYSWTKAICNETSCQDYEIYCNEDKFVNQTAITGAVISIPKGWEDPRNETMKERVCDVY